MNGNMLCKRIFCEGTENLMAVELPEFQPHFANYLLKIPVSIARTQIPE